MLTSALSCHDKVCDMRQAYNGANSYMKRERAALGRPPWSVCAVPQTPNGFAFSWSILYSLIARAASFAVIFPSFASASIAAWAM